MPITLNGTTGVVTPAATVGSLNGILKATNGVVSNATDSDYNSSLSTSPMVAKAWVNFNGTLITSYISATYSQSGTTVTITANAHGFKTGDVIYNNIGSGTAVDGTYTITGTTPNTFTYTAGTSLTTSGNCTIQILPIRSSYNISSVTKNGNGDYTLNFTTAMADTNYSVVASNSYISGTPTPSQGNNITPSPWTPISTTSQRIVNLYSTGTVAGFDSPAVFVQVFGN